MIGTETGRWAVGLALCCWLLSAPVSASVVKETVIFLQQDGRHFTAYTTARTDWPQYDLYLDKERRLSDFLYIYPKAFEWDESDEGGAQVLRFAQSDYALLQPGMWGAEVTQQGDGVMHFRSASGEPCGDGHFGYWTTPGDFDQFVYVWVLPANLEVLGFQANRDGEWVQRNNTLAFYAANVNDLLFEIRYRPRIADR